MSDLAEHLASRRSFAQLRPGEMDEMVQFVAEMLARAVTDGATRMHTRPGEVTWEGQEHAGGLGTMDFGPSLELLLERDAVLAKHVQLAERHGDDRTFLIRA
jgi:hypothetical protein